MELFELYATLSLDTADFDQKIDAAVAKANRFPQSVNESLQKAQMVARRGEELAASMNRKEAVEANLLLTAEGTEAGLANVYAICDAWVGNIKRKLSEIGTAGSLAGDTHSGLSAIRPTGMAGSVSFAAKASGLTYVPYDDYRASLHRGETVLTRQQAEEYRAGRGGAADESALIQEVRGLRDAILGIQLTMDKTVVGQLVSPVVSREIAREAGVFG